MNDVVPSHFAVREMGAQPRDPRPHVKLYVGEVMAAIYPEDKNSLSKRVIEYRVFAQADVYGQPCNLEFPHAVMADAFGGAADHLTWTPRVNDKAPVKGPPGLGSKVLVRCICGDANNAVIVGGVQDARRHGRKKEDGHHLDFEFNGVQVGIDRLGVLTVRRAGPTKPDGTLDKDAVPAEKTGQVLVMDKDGGVTLSTQRGDKVEQSLVLDHTAKTLTVTAQSGLTINVVDGPAVVKAAGPVTVEGRDDVTVTSSKGAVKLKAPTAHVAVGGGQQQPAVLGDGLVKFLTQLLKAIQTLNVSTAVGPSSPPLNAPIFVALEQALEPLLLSRAVTLSQTP